MASWRYEAIDKRGAHQTGFVDASARAGAVDALIARQLTPVAVVRSREAGGRLALGGRAARLTLLRNLAVLLSAKVPVTVALRLVGTLSAGTEKRRLAAAADAVRSGAPLSDGLASAGLLGVNDAAFIAAAEAAGTLGAALTRLVETEARAAALRSELVSAAIYPAILIVALIGTMALIFGAVLPALMPAFAERAAALPFAAQVLMTIHGIVQDWGSLLGLLLCAGLAALLLWARLPSARESFQRAVLRLPMIGGLARNTAGADLARSLAMMLNGGMALSAALDRASAGLGNVHLQRAAQSAAGKVREGARLAAALDTTGAFPAILVELVRVGEETGRLASLCAEAALILEQQIRTHLTRAAALFSPVATLLLGLAVGFVMLGVIGGILAVGAPAP